MYSSNPVSISTDPSSNTGSDSQTQLVGEGLVEAKIDALTLIWQFDRTQDIDGVLRRFLGITVDRIDTIGRKIGVWWDRNYCTSGGSLLSERKMPNGGISCRLAISGRDCARVGSIRLRGFCLWASANLRALNCTRIDLAIDDFGQQMPLKQFRAAIDGKNYSGFKKGSGVEEYGAGRRGHTVYLGRRTSEKMVRAYDKEVESKGQIKSLRWECEYKGETANSLFALLLGFPSDPQELQAKIISYAIGDFKFIDKVDKNIDRCPLLSWWEEWLKYLQCSPLKVFSSRKVSSLASTKNWINRSVAKSLAMLKEALGVYYFDHFLKELIVDGTDRMKNLDKLKVAEYKDFEF